MIEDNGGGDIAELPEGCISHVISLTSPRDACRAAAVSPAFRSAAASDTVWDRFLPANWQQILVRAADPLERLASKRDLYFRLCAQPLLLDAGKLSFWLEKRSGKKCYMISAKELRIVWGDSPHYWRWLPLSDSRFAEVGELRNVCWLEIHGRIDCKILSQKTTYVAYLVFKLSQGSRGLQTPYQETSVRVGNHVDKRTVRLAAAEATRMRNPVRPSSMLRQFMTWRGAVMFPAAQEPDDLPGVTPLSPKERGDGWLEIELGEFFNDWGDDGEVDMSLTEIRGGHWKSGLLVQGIEVRPKA